MQYSFDKILDGNFADNLQKIKQAIPKAGFGIIFENNMKDNFKAKLELDFRNYVMLGICSPKIAYELVNIDENIGVFLPCNIVVQEMSADKTKVSIAMPTAVMQPVENEEINKVVATAEQKLKDIIELI